MASSDLIQKRNQVLEMQILAEENRLWYNDHPEFLRFRAEYMDFFQDKVIYFDTKFESFTKEQLTSMTDQIEEKLKEYEGYIAQGKCLLAKDFIRMCRHYHDNVALKQLRLKN